jgi:hypothetical protein
VSGQVYLLWPDNQICCLIVIFLVDEVAHHVIKKKTYKAATDIWMKGKNDRFSGILIPIVCTPSVRSKIYVSKFSKTVV